MAEPITYYELIAPLLTGAVIIAVVTAVWHLSKKFATLETDSNIGKEQHDKDITELKNLHQHDIAELKQARSDLVLEYSNKIQDLDKALNQRINEAKVERKDEISKALLNMKDEFSVIQKQIDTTKSDVKDVSTRVTEVNTKVAYMEKQIEKLDECDKDTKGELIRMIYRIADKKPI